MSSLLDDIINRISTMDDDEKSELWDAASDSTGDMPWFPLPGPQTEAYFCEADELFYGGQAGGGKTDLIVGLSLTEHKESLLLRRQSKEAGKLFDRIEQILGHTNGRNRGALSQWKIDGRTLDINGCKNEDDKQKFKGIPHDLICFDEISDFSLGQYQFIKTWNRSALPGQKCRVVATGNPPTSAEGLWVIEYWAPWLDPKHPNPAKDGELRWFIQDRDDKTHEVDGSGLFTITHDDGEVEEVRSTSRTFIRARLEDNVYLMDTDYAKTLDSLPAELRAAYRDGKFASSIKDDLWQCIPTSWVLEAQERWTDKPPPGVPMCAIGVDVAQGGADNTVLAPRYDGWFDRIITTPGKTTPLGSDVAALIIGKRKNGAKPIVDMGGGYGGGVVQTLGENNIEYYAYKGAAASTKRTKDKKLGFKNVRTQAYWQLREALDPDQEGGSPISLPPGNRIVADLTAPTFSVVGVQIVLEVKKILVARIGRSPDEGDAVVMSWFDGAKMLTHGILWKNKAKPQIKIGHKNRRRR